MDSMGVPTLGPLAHRSRCCRARHRPAMWRAGSRNGLGCRPRCAARGAGTCWRLRTYASAQLSGRIGFGRGSLATVADLASCPLAQTQDCGLPEAAAAMLARAPERQYDEVIVELADGRPGLVSPTSMFVALTGYCGRQAVTDGLTGLPNRSRLLREFAQPPRLSRRLHYPHDGQLQRRPWCRQCRWSAPSQHSKLSESISTNSASPATTVPVAALYTWCRSSSAVAPTMTGAHCSFRAGTIGRPRRPCTEQALRA